MSNEDYLHIKRLQNRAILSLIALLLAMFCIVFGFLFLMIPSFVAIGFFVVAIVCITYLIYCNRTAKKESRKPNGKPVVFKAERNFSFEEIVAIFENLTDEENKLSISKEVLFFRLKKIFKLRAVLYKTADFNKKDFKDSKDRINKKANKELEISHLVAESDAKKMMRFNIIYTDTLNDALYQFISQNACHNLTRVEGVINIAIIGNQIMIPPIYGDCNLIETGRYKNTIKFINKFLLKQ